MADVKNTLSLELQVKYDQAIKALNEVRTALAAVGQGVPTVSGGDIGGLQKTLAELKTSIGEVKTALAGVTQSVPTGSGGDIGGLQKTLAEIKTSIGEVKTALAGVTQGVPPVSGGDIGGLQKTLAELKTSIGEVKTALSGVSQTGGNFTKGITDQAGKASVELKKVKEDIQNLGDGASNAAVGGLAALSTKLLGLSAGIFIVKQLVDGVSAFGRVVLEAQGRLDNFRAGVQFALGREAGNDLTYVRETAFDLGLELASLSRSYVQFNAAARGTSLEGARAREVFEAVSQSSSVLGLSADRTEGALRALGQMMSKGTVQAEELRGQLGDQLPGAFGIAARAIGVTESKLSEMLERGEIISSDFLPKFAAQLKKELGDSTVTAADGAQQALNRLSGAYERLVQAVSEAGLGAALKRTLNTVSTALNEVSESFERATKDGEGFFGTLLKGYGDYAKFVVSGFKPREEVLRDSITKNTTEAERLEAGGGLYQRSDAAGLRRQIAADRAELEKLLAAQPPADLGLWGDDRRMQALADLAVQRRRLEGEIGSEIAKNLSQIEKAEKALADFRQKYALLSGTEEYKKLETELVRKLTEAREVQGRKGLAQPIPSARRVFDGEAELALDAARREERALQESYAVRLTDLQTYVARRRQIADAALAAETDRQQANIDAQRELLRKLDAITPKTDVQAQTISDRRADSLRTIEQAQVNQQKAQRDRDDIERTLRLFELTERLAQMERARTLVAEGYREVQDRISLAVERREITERQAQDRLAELNRRTADGLRAQAEQYDRIAEAGGVFAEGAARAAAALRLEADKLSSTLNFIEKRFENTADRIDAAFKQGLVGIFEGIGEKGTRAADLIRDAFVNVGKAIRRSLAEIAAEDTIEALNKSLGTGPDGKPNTIGRVLSRAIGADGSSAARAFWVRLVEGSGATATGAQGILPGDVKGVPSVGDVLESLGGQLREVFGRWIDNLGGLFSEIGNSFSGLFDGLFNSLGGLFSGGGGGGGGGFGELLGSFFGSFFHRGGVVGSGQRSGRSISASAWINAPRFHSGGIAGDEVAAVLKKGEEVLTEDDPRHVKNGGGGGMAVKVELVNNGTPQRASSSSTRFDGRQLIVQVVTEDMADNGPISRSIAETLGGNRAAGLA